MNEILALVRERAERRLADRGPIPVWTAMEHALATGQTLTLTVAQMHEALADNAYIICEKNDAIREITQLREQLAAEEVRNAR